MQPWTYKDIAGAIVIVGGWGLCGYSLHRGFRSGRLLTNTGLTEREKDAGTFWTTLVTYAVLYGIFSLLLIGAVVRLMLGFRD
jgi:hypothetical protein